MCSWMNYRKAPAELNEATIQATNVFEITVLFSVVLSHHRQMGLVPQGYK